MPMRLLSRLFPASRTAQNASRIPGRRRPKARGLATPVAARALSLAAESLERRAMLAVTATLVGGDLVIAYNEAGDSVADISSDGTNYTVSGTGLAAKTFTISDVTGVISVADKAAVLGQQFKVNAGTPLANALQVNATVESTSLLGGITTAVAGDVLIGSAAISLANDISTAATNDDIVFTGAVQLSGAASLSTGAGAGDITFSKALDGNQTLSLTAGTGNVTFSGLVGDTTPVGAITINSAADVTANGIRAASLTQVAGSGTTTLNGGAFTSAPAGTEAVRTSGATGVSLTGTNLAVNALIATTNGGTVTFAESGTITIAADGDITSDGAVSLTGDGGITTAGDVTTTNDSVTFASATTLSGPVVINTGVGAGDITFSKALDGNQTLSLTAGTGNVTFSGLVGDTTPVGAITINSAADVTANGIRAASLTQVAGSGTTTLNGGAFTSAPAGTEAVRTSGATGVSLTGTNLAVNALIATTNGGTVTFAESGTITIAADGDITSDGAVSLTGDGGITTAGDVTTTNDSVTFASATTLSGPVVINTGVGAGDITFSKALDGNQTLSLTAGTGNIEFKGAVGSGTPLGGIAILSAASTTADSPIKLDGSSKLAADGLTISENVNNVSFTKTESEIKNFTGNGVFFKGGSTNSLLSGFTVSGNGGNGMSFADGSYAGTTVTANTISDNGDKTAGVGNGILVQGKNLMIGWDADPAANTARNVIERNAENGIEIRGAAATGNSILSNSIFLNGIDAAGTMRTKVENGATVAVGKGIALTEQGNDSQVAPIIHDVVWDKKGGAEVVRVQLVVPTAGSYFVQVFSNTAADEQGIFPVDVNGFEGRAFVGPARAGSTPVAGPKPTIAGAGVVTGNEFTILEIPTSQLAAGEWLTATATRLDGTAPTNTSEFSAGAQLLDAPVLAVGSDGPAVWVPHYTYQALSGNVLRLGGLTVTEVNRLVAMRGRQIFISGNGRSEVATATVASVRRIGGRAVNMVLRTITSPEGSLAGTAGRLEPGPLTLPTARLYDAATGEVVLDVGAEAIAASLEAAGVTPGAAAAFTSRFQGGLRVASGDVNGDGFAELLTAPGVSPAIPAATFGTATRIITIYNGDKAAGWQSVSLDVSGAFPGYSGGFQVTLGDVLPEVPGSGSGVLELIVAGTNKVAVYELTVPGRAAAPVIATTPAAVWTVGPRFRITGLAAGDFSAAVSDEVVVATAAPAGTFVRTFTLADGGFTTQSSFWAWSYVEGDPQRRLRDVFANGASLAVGDIDGAIDGKPELVLAAGSQGLANFRVLDNAVVATGSQAAINQALSMGRRFTQRSRPQFTTVNGRQVWQPAGGPDYFVGVPRLTNAVARGINAPLSVAVVNARGTTAAGQVFAALGPQNATSNMVRRLAWRSLEASWSGTDAFQAQPAGRIRFPLGGGLLLG